MKIILNDANQKLMGEWSRAFGKVPDVEIKNLDDHKHVSVIEVDSFGFSGDKLQNKLQERIKKLTMKELLVGESIYLEDKIYSAINRVPLDISDTSNVYLCFKSALLTAQKEKVSTLVVNGLGLKYGVEPSDCARQMYSAYYDVFDKFPKFPSSIREAYLGHQNLIGIVNMKRRKS